MDYVDVEFPRRIALGAQCRVSWNTAVVQTTSGRITTNQNWSRAKHSYEVGLAVRTQSDFVAVQEHFHMVRGRAKVFPFLDPLDHSTDAAHGALLDDGGSPTIGYHLVKVYGSGGDVYNRLITRPVVDAFHIYRNRAGVITDITSFATVTQGTGVVLFPFGTVLGGDLLYWVGQFHTPCQYDTDTLPAVFVNRQPQGGEALVQVDSLLLSEYKEP